MRFSTVLRVLPALGLVCLLFAGCGDSLSDKYKKLAKGRRKKTHYEIHQPHHLYPNDKVLIWSTPQRKKRKFLLKPGTRVKILKTVDGFKYNQDHDMYLIKTADGRQGWVPAGWCKERKGK